ncbi:kelch-like protein [Chrysochromulina tobinii]|uniref:Kelch-like protein n=1 Tax=Chrysochromulina tobinii TaxID=1460289 RepID=A0A0M0JS35_9EUKA|nr:kelch-like protein [Chrysochromulina tobinii]|eukprot:KOO29404.1 kelch-like protein [Chrysochromulina sp. CCMP291]
MPPAPKRARASADAPSAASIELVGGLAEKPSAIAKFRDGRLTDVEVVAADGTAFHAHALCITSGSEYFERLLAGERWADTAGRPLSLPEVPKQGLAACLEFIYTGSCAVADEAELMVVLQAAAYLQIRPLVDAAAKAMSAHLSATTALAFWAVADRQGLSQLAADAVSAAARHFEQIAATPAWLSAPAEMVHVLVASDRLKVADEEAVYSAAVKWLHAQAPPPAEDDALELLRLVRFPLLSREFVQETVHNEPLLRTFAGMQMLSNYFFGALHGDSARRRMGFEQLYIVGGYDGSDALATFHRFDSMANVWEAMAPMSTARSGLAAAAVDGKLYVMDGADDDGHGLSSVERYDLAKNAWEAVAPMSTARYALAAAAVDGKLYVMGGADADGHTLSSVEQYDSTANVWEAMPSMSTARSGLAAVAVDGKLYVMGGNDTDDESSLSSVERYDLAKNAWEAVAPMSTARDGFAAAAVDGKLYVMGGFDGQNRLSSVERYDPATNAWEAVAPMSTARSCSAAAVFDGKLYVMGGHDGKNWLSSVEQYDPAKNEWVTMASMVLNTGTHSLCAVSL